MSECGLVCEPIFDLKSVLQWTLPETSWADKVTKKSLRSNYCLRGASFCESSKTKIATSGVSKTLLCHDMKGGYLDDKFVEGSENCKAFSFVHWSCVDIFVYFSHNFLTIPPLAWINSAHLHGVTVLGTLITEWTNGKTIWTEVLEDPSKTMTLCEKLSEICNHYGFDGYLINIENDIDPKHIFSLVDFIKILKCTLSSYKEDSIVIWYDSVTLPAGKVAYQNKLNGYNQGFFESCDGIFLNYNWSENDLKLSAMNANDRLSDVFVGVDIFGRGCYGGGGFSTNLAVEMARMHGLSVAMFAPGWVHETCPDDESFEERDDKFWSLLHPILFTRGPAQLPFVSSFCRGYGKKFYRQGIEVSDSNWYNLSKQSYQPTELIKYHTDKSNCISFYNNDAFNGGGCLLVRPCHAKADLFKSSIPAHRLFQCEFNVALEEDILVSVTTSPMNSTSSSELIIILILETLNKQITKKILCSRMYMENCKEMFDFVLPEKTSELYENRTSTWQVREFQLNLGAASIVAVECALSDSSEPILLGEIGIYPVVNQISELFAKSDNSDFLMPSINLHK